MLIQTLHKHLEVPHQQIFLSLGCLGVVAVYIHKHQRSKLDPCSWAMVLIRGDTGAMFRLHRRCMSQWMWFSKNPKCITQGGVSSGIEFADDHRYLNIYRIPSTFYGTTSITSRSKSNERSVDYCNSRDPYLLNFNNYKL